MGECERTPKGQEKQNKRAMALQTCTDKGNESWLLALN